MGYCEAHGGGRKWRNLVDALDLGSNVFGRESSSLSFRTTFPSHASASLVPRLSALGTRMQRRYRKELNKGVAWKFPWK